MRAPQNSIYIAGPMRGYPYFNHAMFHRAEEWAKMSWDEVISPARHDVEIGFDAIKLNLFAGSEQEMVDNRFDVEAVILWDLAQVERVDDILLLPGWEDSVGARGELRRFLEVNNRTAVDHDVYVYGERQEGSRVVDALCFSLEEARELLETALKTAGSPPLLPSTPSATGEVRMTSDTGGAKGSKPARFDLIPVGVLRELAEHFGKGAIKYEQVNGVDNWRNGYPWSLSYAAAQRHLNDFWEGQDLDPETGSKHLIAAAWHCLVLAHQLNRKSQKRFDDRQEPRTTD